MRSDTSVPFDVQCDNLTKEAEEILNSKSLKISPTAKFKYEQSFIKYLELKRLLGNYSIPLGVIAALLIGITVFLFLYCFDIQKYWMYVLLITSGVILTILIAVFGFFWKRASLRLKRRQMNNWIAKRFFSWSETEINKEQNLNRKRFLIENFLDLHTRFSPPNPESKGAVKAAQTIKDIINNEQNQAPICLICIIFKKVFHGHGKVYNEAGRNVATKILAPIAKHSTNEPLKTEINKIIDDFWRDTNIDVRMSTLNVGFMDPEEDVVLEKKMIEGGTCGTILLDCVFFEDLWKIDDDVMELYRKDFFQNCPSETPELTCPPNILNQLNDTSNPRLLASSNQHNETPSDLVLFDNQALAMNHTEDASFTIPAAANEPIVISGQEAGSLRQTQLMSDVSANKGTFSRILDKRTLDSNSSLKTIEMISLAMEGPRDRDGQFPSNQHLQLGSAQQLRFWREAASSEQKALATKH